jgi:hypothetical protein
MIVKYEKRTAYMAATRSGPGGKIHSEGSNPTLKTAVAANMGVPTRAVRDINVNGAGNLFSAGTCHNHHKVHKM